MLTSPAQVLLSLNSFKFTVVSELQNDNPVPNVSATSAGILLVILRVNERRDKLEDRAFNRVFANWFVMSLAEITRSFRILFPRMRSISFAMFLEKACALVKLSFSIHRGATLRESEDVSWAYRTSLKVCRFSKFNSKHWGNGMHWQTVATISKSSGVPLSLKSLIRKRQSFSEEFQFQLL